MAGQDSGDFARRTPPEDGKMGGDEGIGGGMRAVFDSAGRELRTQPLSAVASVLSALAILASVATGAFVSVNRSAVVLNADIVLLLSICLTIFSQGLIAIAFGNLSIWFLTRPNQHIGALGFLLGIVVVNWLVCFTSYWISLFAAPAVGAQVDVWYWVSTAASWMISVVFQASTTDRLEEEWPMGSILGLAFMILILNCAAGAGMAVYFYSRLP